MPGYAGGWLSSKSNLPEAHKRGSFLEDGTKVQRKSNRSDAITLAGITVAPEDETKHFKLIGTTGTGKSTAIREILGGALLRGDRAVIAHGFPVDVRRAAFSSCGVRPAA
jgi:hypothetical protein